MKLLFWALAHDQTLAYDRSSSCQGQQYLDRGNQIISAWHHNSACCLAHVKADEDVLSQPVSPECTSTQQERSNLNNLLHNFLWDLLEVRNQLYTSFGVIRDFIQGVRKPFFKCCRKIWPHSKMVPRGELTSQSPRS